MALLNWKPDYLIGHTRIDAEHQHLFDLINAFHYAFVQSRDRREILQLLNSLVQYAEEHFQREEQLMAEHAYPGLERHREIHAGLFETIFRLQGKLEQASIKLEKDTFAFLRTWLTEHIVEHDMEFGRFLRH